MLLMTMPSPNLGDIGQLVQDNFGNLYVTSAQTGVIEQFSSSGADLGVFARGTNQYSPGLAYDPLTGIFYQSGYSDGTSTDSGTIQEFSSTGVSLGYLATGLDTPFMLSITPSVVPEPATFISSTIGLACVGAYAWRRRRASVRAGNASKTSNNRIAED